MRPAALVVLAALGTTVTAAQQPAPPTDWTPMATILGRAAQPQPGGVMTFRVPRTDLAVTVGAVRVRPALALGSWVAFLPTAGGVMAVGDLVLVTAEVAPVMRALEQGGIEATAVHNHLIGESPRLVYLHLMASGDAARIAATLRTALALTATPLVAPPPAPAEPFPLDTAALARALGASGRINGGVYQVGVPRTEPVVAMGVTLPPAMGLATVINIQPLDSTRVAATGDFVLTAAQVTPVIRALTEHGVAVTAVHSHLMASTPTLLFVHFWGEGDAIAVAAAIGGALAATKP